MLLETDRLILRHLRPTDPDELLRMKGDPIVMKYIGDGSIRTHEQMVKEIETLISYYRKEPGMGVWAIEMKTSSGFTGAGGLTYNTNKAEVELGYRLLREQWNKGYVTEVANGLLKYALDEYGNRFCSYRKQPLSACVKKSRNEAGWKRVEFNASLAYYEIGMGSYNDPTKLV